MAQHASFFKGMNKQATADEVRRQLKSKSFEEEFDSELLSDLIAEKHYYCSRHGLRPNQFRKLRHEVWDYDLQVWFSERHKWHSVSWYQCVYPRRNQDWIARALRDAIAPESAARKRMNPTCERCGNASSDETHHVEPTFQQIVTDALSNLSDQDWEAILDRFDWWSDEPFSLPPNSPALIALREIHSGAKLIAVCTPCHRTLERQKKNR